MSFTAFASDVAHGPDRPVINSIAEPSLIAFGDMRVANGIFDHDIVKGLVPANVAPDRHGITGARMREGERLAADSGIGGEALYRASLYVSARPPI